MKCKIFMLFRKMGMIPHILCLLKSVSHKKLSVYFSFVGHNVGHRETKKPKLLGTAIQDLYSFRAEQLSTLGRIPAIYSQTGVGVYQGECVTFRRWELPGGTETHPWVFDKLRYQDLEKFQPLMIQQLCCCACFLARYYKQFYSEKMDSQELHESKLMKCPYGHEEQLRQLLKPEVAENIDISASQRLPEQSLMQERQHSQPKIACPFEGIINRCNGAVNHKQTEPRKRCL